MIQTVELEFLRQLDQGDVSGHGGLVPVRMNVALTDLNNDPLGLVGDAEVMASSKH